MSRRLTIAAAALAALAASGALAQQQPFPAAMFIEQWDGDADGKVTPAEAEEKRKQIFYMFDTDENEVLSEAEWAGVDEHLAAELGQGPGAGQAAGQGRGPGRFVRESLTVAFNDGNGDGVVTKDEFAAASAKLFPMLDQNGDGIVAADDLGRP